MIQTFTRRRRPEGARIFAEIPDEEHDRFCGISYTIGGMMVFPGYPIDRQWTINQARGLHPKIAVRIDLTLECIRRHYLGEDSQLVDVLRRYGDFFELFEPSTGTSNISCFKTCSRTVPSHVKFFIPCDDFQRPSVPQDVDEYINFRNRSSVVHARTTESIGWSPHQNLTLSTP